VYKFRLEFILRRMHNILKLLITF